MKPQFKEQKTTKDYITHVMLHGERIIPSDSFEIGENEYLLLRIRISTEGVLYLKLIGIKGSNFGKKYLVPKNSLEGENMNEIEETLNHYHY